MQPHRSAFDVRPRNDQLSNNGTTRESKSEPLLTSVIAKRSSLPLAPLNPF
jgi:hypothetical protein